MRRFLTLSLSLACLFTNSVPAQARYGGLTRQPYHAYYTQQQVCNLPQKGDRITVVGDSLTGRGPAGGNWMAFLQQYCDSAHPDLGLKFYNAGNFYLSSTVLNYPGQGSIPWQTYVVNTQPNIVVIWIGLDNVLFYGNNFDMAQYGVDLQNIINAARAIPSVRDVVLVTPFLAGEQPEGWNAHDVGITRAIQVINQTSVNNNIPVIDLRSMGLGAEQVYNSAHFPYGVLTGEGIHPYDSTSLGDHENFYSQLCENLIWGDIAKAFGL